MQEFLNIPQIHWDVVLPTLIVILTGVVALLVEIIAPNRNNNLIVGFSLAGLAMAGFSIVNQFGLPTTFTFADMIFRDHFGLVLQLLLVGICFLTFLFSESYMREKKIAYAEFYPLALWSVSGAMLMITTTNMLEIFLGLEVLSISLYCLAGMSRQETKSEESAIKYFLLGAFASAFLLMGIAFIFGATGSLDLRAINGLARAGSQEHDNLLVFGLGMILVGLGFKSALVPFHQWTPDVYQGAPTHVTAFMAAASKVAAIGVLIRVLDSAVAYQNYWFQPLVWIAILTMTVGNFSAVVQKDVKRILGYSSIANAGYILVAVLAHFKDPKLVSMSTTIFFLVAYSVMTLGAFAVISLAAKDGKEGTRLQDLNGLFQKAPFAVGCLVVFIASLIGIPPSAGFFGKFMIFNDAMNSGMSVLAIVLAVNSVVSAYYYLGILVAAFVQEEGALKNRASKSNFAINSAIVICLLGVFLVTLVATPIENYLNSERSPVSSQVQANAGYSGLELDK